MLNKEICKRCYEKKHKNSSSEEQYSIKEWNWGKADEELWSDGLFDCRKEYGGFRIDDKPPNECPYKLEHVLKNDSTNNK